MENLFSKAISREADSKLTENGAMAFSQPSDSSLLKLFTELGALRSRGQKDIEDLFAAAYAEDADLAVKALFYAADVRGGLGERRTFLTCLGWLAFNHPDSVRKNIMYIPFFNRFDAWYSLVGTPCEDDMWRAMRTIWSADMINYLNGDPITLLAKWMKSINTSSKESRALAKMTIKNLKFPDEKTYRKALSQLRARIHVVEKGMSAQRWEGINYSGVPSYAMKNYAKAFSRHDFERFNQYILDLKEGRAKINSSTLFPYDLVKPYLDCSGSLDESITDAQWKALPNYLEDERTNILCMADVSGSMSMSGNRPMATSIGLSLYFAERSRGAFRNLYMTFTEEPFFIKVNPNDSLRKKVNDAVSNGVGYGTNLEAAFELILKTALVNDVPNSDMPKALVVISDMEIDYFRPGNEVFHIKGKNLDFVETMKIRFERSGYSLPKLIFFQAESRSDTFLTQGENVLWVSGNSPSVFKTILNNLDKSAYELMLNTLNAERYSIIKA